jgi:MFS family permease
MRERSEFKTGWPLLLSVMLGVGLGLSPLPFYTIGMLAPELHKAYGWSFGAIMLGLPVSTAGVVLAGPVVGWLGDRIGVRRVAIVSLVLFALAFMGFSLTNGSLPLYYANWALMAVCGTGTLPTTWTRAINNGFESNKGLALGIALMGTGLFGFGIKPFLSWIIAEHGWRAAYVATGLLPLLIALPVALLAFRDPGEKHARATISAIQPGSTLAEALRDRRFWLIGGGFLLFSFAIAGPLPNMENLLRLKGFSRSEIGGLVPAIGLSVIVGRVAGGWLVDRFWAPAVALALLCLPAIACLILGQASVSHGGALLAISLIGAAAGMEFDLLAFLIARYFGPRSYSTLYGCLYGSYALGSGLGPVAFGADFDRTGGYALSLNAAAVLLLLGGAVLLLLGRYRFASTPETIDARIEAAAGERAAVPGA